MATAAAAIEKRSHPKGLPVLFLTEMWERFSFYLMLAILSLYMNAPTEEGGLGFSIATTGQIYGLYIGVVYFTPLFGGIIADRWLGIRRTVIAGGAFFILGHLLLAFHPLPFFFAGLTSLVIGNGLFKPNISTMLGNLYDKVPEKKDDGYNIFYLGINLGAFASPLVAAWTRSQWGWHAAFATAAVGMVISMLIFLSFQRLVKEGDQSPAARKLDHKQEPIKHLDPALAKKRVAALLVVFAVVIVFWMAFSQQGLTLTFWARNASTTALPPEMFSAVNPFFILVLTFPLIAFWQRLRSRGKEPSTAAKLAIGMALTAIAYTVMFTAGLQGGNIGKVSVSWLVTTYAIITTGELCLSPMGLSLVSKLAPPSIASMMMGGWFVSTAIGNYLAGAVGGSLWGKVPNSMFFLVFVGAAFVVFIVAVALLKWLDPIIHQAEKEAADEAAAGGHVDSGGSKGNPLLMPIVMVAIAAAVALIVGWIGHSDKIEEVADTNSYELGWGRTAHLVGVREATTLVDEPTQDEAVMSAIREELVGQRVSLVFPEPELTDQSNDLNVYLEMDGRDVGAWLIKQGYALADIQTDHPKREEYKQLQDKARETGVGFWGNVHHVQGGMQDGMQDMMPDGDPSEMQGDKEEGADRDSDGAVERIN